jgi:predicted DNA-binding ribbon-helix-helix protein
MIADGPSVAPLPARVMASNEDAGRHTALVMRNVNVHGKRTSIRLEPQLWDTLAEISRRERCTVHDVCSYAADRRPPHGSLASSLRVVVLDYFRTASTEAGHRSAGHGQGMFLAQQEERLRMRKARADLMGRPEGSKRDPLPDGPGTDSA